MIWTSYPTYYGMTAMLILPAELVTVFRIVRRSSGSLFSHPMSRSALFRYWQSSLSESTARVLCSLGSLDMNNGTIFGCLRNSSTQSTQDPLSHPQATVHANKILHECADCCWLFSVQHARPFFPNPNFDEGCINFRGIPKRQKF